MLDKKKGFSKSLLPTGSIILVLLILVLINFIFSHVNLRWDLTEDKLYSLSDSTKKNISNLNKDVTIKIFYSKSVANIPVNIKAYAGRMLDFLSEYEYYSNNKIKIEVYDPKVDSEEEEWAQKYNIKGINLPTGDRIYLGLVAMAADQEEVIQFMDPAREKNLEYDITKIILKVQSPKRQNIGIISGLPVFGQQPMPLNMLNQRQQMMPWLFATELKKTYSVSKIDLSSTKIDKDISLLIIIHPKNLSDNIQYAIDQYILKGGNLIVFVDPFSTADNSPGRSKSSSLEKLFSAWGITMDSSKAVVDFNYFTKLRTQTNQVENNPFWISLDHEAFNTGNIITSNLEKILLPVAGAIKRIQQNNDDIKYEALIQSSTNAALADTFKVNFRAKELRRDFTPANEKYDLAVKISGIFKTAFPEGKAETGGNNSEKNISKEKDESRTSEKESLKKGKKESTIIITADTDMLFDGYYVSRQKFFGFDFARIFNDNLNFLLNACEILAGNGELIDIRSRGKFERPFTRVQALEKKAETQWLSREQELERKVEQTNQKLRELEKQKDVSQKFILSRKQESEIRKFQEEKFKINKELKMVRRNLRAEIESLGSFVKFINIFLMPLLVSISGIVYAFYKHKKFRL